MPLLEGEGVTRYFGGLAAVYDVNLAVEPGEIVGLIGPNGAGKTTLFNLISGALAPRAGVIRFKGRAINGLKPNTICKMGLARTFQSVKIFCNMQVMENILLGAMFGTPGMVPGADAARVATESLEFVDLSALRDRPARDLTLVNQKRVEVARALATKPEMLLLDELMAGLNPTEVAQSMDLVARIRDGGVTILMIEHVMKAIMSICDRIIVLHHGKKIAEGTPREIATSKTVVEVYLGE